MKIVAVDNFNRENYADFLVCENILSDAYAKVMVDALNAKYGGEFSPSFFEVKSDDYVLWRGMEELI